ncbi:MAG: GlsB/YeaQ/YmgE family stress response membrane protein [Bacteroidales bacterium]|nr:GlsB/YeaQ/YmgE family stress response membrane protein [Bacteroidales bacterium]
MEETATGLNFDKILFVLIGIAAGYVAAKLMTKEKQGLGLIVNCVIGILGSLLAGWFCPIVGIKFADAWYGDFLQALVGAIAILAAINFLKK